jgi:hypothetical protein
VKTTLVDDGIAFNLAINNNGSIALSKMATHAPQLAPQHFFWPFDA